MRVATAETLFADDFATAETLLQGLTAGTDDDFYLDVPDGVENPTAAQLVGRFGMMEVWRCAQMYTRGRPRMDAGRRPFKAPVRYRPALELPEDRTAIGAVWHRFTS
jgi:hypothetical protein